MNLSKIIYIIEKDIKVELRQKHAIASIILFAITCSYLIYRTFGVGVSAQVWNIMIWILVIFAGLNAVVKSFIQEKNEVHVYYYTLFSPLDVVIAKLVYNFLFLTLLLGILILVFTILLGMPIVNYNLFLIGGILGILGISSIFTFVSLISSAGNNNNTMMSILALPLILPLLMLLVKITSVSMNLMVDSQVMDDVNIVIGIDIMLLAIILLIFPSLWRS